MDEEQLIEEMKQAWKDSIRAGGYVNDAWRAVIEVCPVHENKSIRWKERAEAAEARVKELEASLDQVTSETIHTPQYDYSCGPGVAARVKELETERDELKAQLSQLQEGEEEVWWVNVYRSDGAPYVIGIALFDTKEGMEYHRSAYDNNHIGAFPIRLPAKKDERQEVLIGLQHALKHMSTYDSDSLAPVRKGLLERVLRLLEGEKPRPDPPKEEK